MCAGPRPSLGYIRDMMEAVAKHIQDQLGFRVEKTNAMGEPGCQVVHQGADGSDASVHPVASVWPWAMWEHIRELYLIIDRKDTELADLRGQLQVRQGRKASHINADGDIVVTASLPTGSADSGTAEGS